MIHVDLWVTYDVLMNVECMVAMGLNTCGHLNLQPTYLVQLRLALLCTEMWFGHVTMLYLSLIIAWEHGNMAYCS